MWQAVVREQSVWTVASVLPLSGVRLAVHVESGWQQAPLTGRRRQRL